MFERNKVDTPESGGLAVEITTDDGEMQAGRLSIPLGRSLADALNSPGTFIEFEPWGTERIFLAKAALRRVRVIQAPRPESLKGRIAAADSFDPHTILGIPVAATYEDAKAAWHRLSKAYHPDRYANAELPPEVVDYLGAMARRVNAAWAALETQLQAQRRAAAYRAPPVYTPPSRV
jgi:hypothetical protein